MESGGNKKKIYKLNEKLEVAHFMLCLSSQMNCSSSSAAAK